MSVGFFGASRLVRSFCWIVIFVVGTTASVAVAGLSEAERITLDQPSCAQMKAYSQDITLLNDEMQNVRKFGQRSRMCDVLGRATTAIGNAVGYMQSHIGECTITADSTDRMATLGRQFETDRRKLCR